MKPSSSKIMSKTASLAPSRGTLGLLLGGLALACWPTTTATAGLNYDLRVNGGKTALVLASGQTVTLDLFAQVTGAAGNAGVEGFQDGFGSIRSSTGGNIAGNLSSSFVAPFNGAGKQAGTQQTLDADTDLDLGSNLTVHSTDFFFARSDAMTISGGTPITNGTEFKIATFTFTVTSIVNLNDFTPITINFQVPLFSNGVDIEAVWQEDGLGVNSNGVNGGTQPTVGSAVTIAVPEPSTMGLLLVAAGSLGLRRRRARQA